jgi:hypothetical protein
LIELKPIQTLSCEKVIKEIPTSGSSPLLVLGSDMNFHFAKTCKNDTPRIELINEMVCAYLAQCWSLKVPSFSLLQIDKDVIEAFRGEVGNILSGRYPASLFPSIFFASKQLKPAIELDVYFGGFKGKPGLKLFSNPTDLIKIGVFDVWIGNKDRKRENPNILLNEVENSVDFCPIDHSAAFAYCTDYRQVSPAFMFMEERFKILTHPMIRAIAHLGPKAKTVGLKDELLADMELALNNIDFIFEQIPASWGFSKKAKAHVKAFLSDNERNKRVAESYTNYLN